MRSHRILSRVVPVLRSTPIACALLSLAAVAQTQSPQSAKIPRPRQAEPDVKLPEAPLPDVHAPFVDAPQAQLGAPSASQAGKQRLPSGWPLDVPQPGHDAVMFDQPGDGALWARGRDYKMRFDESGACFVPYLGSCASANRPLALRLESATAGGAALEFTQAIAPVRDGAHVSFDRGGLLENFDLEPTGVEHSFVLAHPSAAGDLVLRIRVESDLLPVKADSGFDFSCREGGVRYGEAWLVDADGTKTAASTTWSDGALEIRVRGATLQEARFPVTIDPLLTTFAIDTSAANTYYADSSFDASTGRYAFVYAQDFSANDVDVYATQYSALGAYVAGSLQAIDYTSDAWYYPKIANNRLASQFLVAMNVWPSAGGTHQIGGRTYAAASFAMGTQFLIGPADAYEKFWPDVGGDASLIGPTYYFVSWTRFFSSTDYDIHAQLVTTAGANFGPMILVDNSGGTLDHYPAISRTNGLDPFGTQAWNVVWSRIISSGDYDVLGARYGWDGTLLAPTFPIATGATNDIAPEVSTIQKDSGGPRRYLATWMNGSASHDVKVAVMEGASVLGTYNLSALEGVAQAEDQNSPSVDCDGRQFALAYGESKAGSTTDYDIYTTTLALVGTNLRLGEAHSPVATSTAHDFYANLVATGAVGGNEKEYGIGWTQGNGLTGSGPYDVRGAIYEGAWSAPFCFPGEDAIACPCGNAPAGSGRGCDNSAATGGAYLYASDHDVAYWIVLHALDMLPSPTCIFLQGSVPVSPGAGFGDGVRCVGGQLLRLAVKTASGGAAHYPTGSDLSIPQRCAALGAPIASGTDRFYQTYYRDPQSFGCAAPATYNITSAVLVLW